MAKGAADWHGALGGSRSLCVSECPLRTRTLLAFLLEQLREGDCQMLPAAEPVPWPDGCHG